MLNITINEDSALLVGGDLVALQATANGKRITAFYVPPWVWHNIKLAAGLPVDKPLPGIEERLRLIPK